MAACLVARRPMLLQALRYDRQRRRLTLGGGGGGEGRRGEGGGSGEGRGGEGGGGDRGGGERWASGGERGRHGVPAGSAAGIEPSIDPTDPAEVARREARAAKFGTKG